MGYGDNDEIVGNVAKIFTTVYVFVGVSMVFTCISIIIKAVDDARQKKRNEVSNLSDFSNLAC